ncbi:MAG: hypothetical protein HFK07_04385 [Clostridia bacterium]|jgi:hypothetical protein|nr:hypothetical protein [Clostridia bacterium]MCX4367012.1 hypothetical protein [Clostridia bacterium]
MSHNHVVNDFLFEFVRFFIVKEKSAALVGIRFDFLNVSFFVIGFVSACSQRESRREDKR